MAQSYGGYTTNVAMADLLSGRGWIAVGYDGQPIPAQHGGPGRLLIPHLLYGLTMLEADQPGFWESNGAGRRVAVQMSWLNVRQGLPPLGPNRSVRTRAGG